jgi:hypothetical protein
VIYASIGRRLGYPVKLVNTRSHLFSRWEGPGGERFNIEANDTGLACPPDDHYRTGLYRISDVEERECHFLRSQTPREELAWFLVQRGWRWLDVKNYREAAEAYLWATELSPDNLGFGRNAITVLKMWGDHLKASLPAYWPDLVVRFPAARRFPSVPASMEREFISWEVAETVLRDPRHEAQWWGPMRASPGWRPPNLPRVIEVRVQQ